MTHHLEQAIRTEISRQRVRRIDIDELVRVAMAAAIDFDPTHGGPLGDIQVVLRGVATDGIEYVIIRNAREHYLVRTASDFDKQFPPTDT